MGTGVAHWFRPDRRLALEEVQQYLVNMAFRILAADASVLDGVDFIVAPAASRANPTVCTPAS